MPFVSKLPAAPACLPPCLPLARCHTAAAAAAVAASAVHPRAAVSSAPILPPACSGGAVHPGGAQDGDHVLHGAQQLHDVSPLCLLGMLCVSCALAVH